MSNAMFMRELIALRSRMADPVSQLAIRLAMIAAAERARTRTVWPRQEGPLS